jgi:hypothetical protein
VRGVRRRQVQGEGGGGELQRVPEGEFVAGGGRDRPQRVQVRLGVRCGLAN